MFIKFDNYIEIYKYVFKCFSIDSLDEGYFE